MSKLDQRLSILEQEAPEFLFDYYEPSLYSFSIAPGRTDTLSVTSTAYAVRALLEYPVEERPVILPTRNIIQALIDSDWRENDLYDVSLLTLVILRLDPDLSIVASLEDTTIQKFVRLLTLVLSGRPQRRRGEQQQFSAYISYLCCSVYVTLQSVTKRNPETGQLQLGVLNSDVLDDNSNVDDDNNNNTTTSSSFWMNLTVAVSRSAETSFNELCRQLAYRAAGDYSGSFDIIKLVYSLLSYVKSTESLRGTAGTTERVLPGQGISTDDGKEEVIKMNTRLVKTALKAFFDEQDRTTGLWDRGQPIYKSFRRQGRNVGNAYVFGIDALGSLLELLPPEDFRPYLSNLDHALEWLESNQDVQIIADYCDPETGQCFGKSLRGWSSPFLSPPTGPIAWATAQSVTCLARMRRIVRQLLHNDVLEEFRGKKTDGPDSKAWNRLLDSDVGTPGSSSCRTIKSILEERVILPFSESVTAPSVGAAYSTILFGSPGTAKTTITEAVAESLGWDFVVIDTSVFLEDGLSNIASRIRYVFTRLMALRYCVILFDEIEEFCLDREAPGITMQSRMLTTAMLTAINDLRRTKQSVFFLATNRLRAFDSAIIRPGRFDIQLFVGTPNLEARVTLLDQAFSTITTIPDETKEEAKITYKKFLESHWTKDAMFMNYLEGKQFATSVANIVSKGRSLDDDELNRILSQQAAVMTARGQVREEYIAQMDLSRL
ncbi:ATP-dependent metalloprotease FtsH [Nitzschia inconspicua]|uniref:ATP-dependent metalloprotease FtsH n=1 Tax=Nitzschia inconspicua TaxID=303405 RepID=A0A9K3L4L3_9STRA|nr:ATP-dependent metalloprotease FtsH [Nitzschia inconspicua]